MEPRKGNQGKGTKGSQGKGTEEGNQGSEPSKGNQGKASKEREPRKGNQGNGTKEREPKEREPRKGNQGKGTKEREPTPRKGNQGEGTKERVPRKGTWGSLGVPWGTPGGLLGGSWGHPWLEHEFEVKKYCFHIYIAKGDQYYIGFIDIGEKMLLWQLCRDMGDLRSRCTATFFSPMSLKPTF